MTTTLSITLPSVASVTSADWGATFHRWTKAIAAVLVVPYVAGLMAGDVWHRLVAWANAHHLTGLARLGLPSSSSPEFPDNSFDRPRPVLAAVHLISDEACDELQSFIEQDQKPEIPVFAPVSTQRLAPAPLPTIAAPPLESLTVAQLRQMARAAGHKGIARSGRRAELLQVLAG